MFAILKGKKTYITGVLAVLTAIGSVLTGDATIIEGAQLGFAALMGVFLRNGIK